MMTQDNVLHILAAAVVLVLLSLLQNLINCKKELRFRQSLLPLLALVCALGMTMFAGFRFDAARAFCSKYGFLVDGEIPVLNAAMLLIWILLKIPACLILGRSGKEKRSAGQIAGQFYEYAQVYSQWFLRDRWADYRGVLTAFSLCGTLAAAILVSAAWAGGPNSIYWLYFFPAAALLVINECRCFLAGQTREEFVHSVLGQETEVRRISSFYRLREIYEGLFAPQLLASHTGSEFSARQGVTELLDRLESSPDLNDNAVAQFFNTYGAKEALDPDCVQATCRLMQRENVVFFNPFYRDLGPYLTLPMVSSLLRGRKVLVLAGRNSSREDVIEWLSSLLRDYSHMRSLWRVRELDANRPDCEVGVLSFKHLYDIDVLKENREFFEEADFVLLLEPSMMVNTGQIGLSIIAEESRSFDDLPVFCICDRYTDGLVDTMSHLLHSEITTVVAMPVPRCTYTGMAWNADGDFLRQRLFDKQTRFLGNGLELAAVAVKNQIPKVTWFGESKAPLRDIRWIAGQHHPTICKFMNLPIQQKSLYEKLCFVPTLWTTQPEREQFLIAEDEFCNMFSMMRAYLSRGKDQTFVNILSENYLVRDYMRCNQQMFLSNPNAVPSMVPDYAKTERNTLLKLLILMASRPVSQEEVRSELELSGVVVTEVYDCLLRLIEKYSTADPSILEIRQVVDEADSEAAHEVTYFSVSKGNFENYFDSSLKNASYIVEEERRDVEFIDAKMFGHVCQTVLPGQFVCYDGKYYQVRSISPANGIILRRASDQYNGREYYRQIRRYVFESAQEELVSTRLVRDVEISTVRRDLEVLTEGYLVLPDNHDLRMARTVRYEGDPHAGDYRRSYRRKDVLRLRLPDTDDRIRFTLSLLLSELFRSVFPNAWQYLAVCAGRPKDIEGMLNHMVYTLEGDFEEDCIYVIEDSEIDLGLLDAVDKNLFRFLEILADYLDWHFEKMREPEHKDPVLGEPKYIRDERRKRLSFLERIRRIFAREKEKEETIPSVEQVEKSAPPAEQAVSKAGSAGRKEPGLEPSLDEESREAGDEDLPSAKKEEEGGDLSLDDDKDKISNAEDETSDEDGDLPPSIPDGPVPPEPEGGEEPEDDPELALEPGKDSDIVDIDGTDIFEDAGSDADLELRLTAAGIAPIRQTRYQKECFLKFGFDEIDARLKIEDLRRYLRVRGCCDNALTRARKRDVFLPEEFLTDTCNHCDFCGRPISGVSYELLSDGRTRCNDCSSSAIETEEEFRELFYRVLELMEDFYHVSYHIPIRVQMADARTVAQGAGAVFHPTTGVAPRVLGFAQRSKGQYSILMENGSPRLAAIDTMVHEMTHVWQYMNWDEKKLNILYGDGVLRELVCEGMATWAAVQFLYQLGETCYAAQQEALLSAREDIYGEGFRAFCARFPLVKDLSLLKNTPFNVFPPI